MTANTLDQPLSPAGSAALGGWLRAALTLCLLGLPVVLGYFACQQAARQADAFQDKTALAWMDTPAGQALLAPGVARVAAVFPSLRQPRAALARLPDPRGSARAVLAHVPAPRHKHGRVVDPAAYRHRTRC